MPDAADRFLINLWSTPHDWQREVFCCAVRAGHLVAGARHRIERPHYPGHEWIFCLQGEGWVQLGGKRQVVRAGDLAWVNCHRAHAYGATPSRPWQVYWVRVEGPMLERCAQWLLIDGDPVFKGLSREACRSGFERVFERMAGDRPSDAAAVHEALTGLLTLCFEIRLNEPDSLQATVPEPLRQVLQHMRKHAASPLRVAELAAMAGMSESAFGRQFRRSMGTSPINWLRHERIKRAQRRLIESDDSIKEIAAQVGYGDQFFFGKDFKRMTGLAPSRFREEGRP